ncbi:pantoate--beta-alanine ligase [Sphaerimonospora thailandensis]|uniref:Pantothenate synthetase n=1 Tax=Sphaerimonospora thailandensis TaxID=795644 RepID=A0A8J3VZV5_9ACTN|nr:pantoate--beta-alanine ligase [Sphaerimonospora thailandensis]GIH70847.1 pantothenate synthetase 1 [Sphaerimonospora thailandensis]
MDLTVAGDRTELAKALEALAGGHGEGRTEGASGGRTGGRGAGRVALVPTMGALHEGHRSLIRLAHEHADHVVVSVFVNPLQFGPGEDFSRYPRTFEADLAACAEENVSVVFAPAADDLYLPDRQVGVSSGHMGTVVEGAYRPGHFDGMLTVVLKLFNLVRPDVAVFGQKDAQQFALIRRMVADLDVPVSVVAGPTLREPDGLALSSRNRYLSPEDRTTALALSRALQEGARYGTPKEILRAARAVLDGAARARPPLVLDYLVLADPATFAEVGDDHRGEAVLAVAARVGATRLIDNVVVRLPG